MALDSILDYPNVVPSDWIWKSPGYPKMQLFLWQMWWGRMPSNVNIHKRIPTTNKFCIFCPHMEEDMNHILRSCPRATEIWVGLKINLLRSNQLNDWLNLNLNNCEISPFAKVPINVIFGFALWFLWIRRNSWVFKKENIKSDVLIKKLCWAATEWFYTKSHTKVGKAPNPPASSTILQWTPPKTSYLKINTDASFLSSSKEACLAAVCRNELGIWVEGIQSKSLACDSAEAEIKAIFMALNWVRDKGWRKVIIATDSMIAWKATNTMTNLSTNTSSLSNECRVLSLELHDVTIIHEGRVTNALADALAKEAKGRRDGFNTICILSNPPPECLRIYDCELNNVLLTSSVEVQEPLTP
ncbi:uncharacterized protein LOC125499483 [Beta vulgaris subsp. vulgaris]|uniref:uncharacterized protein LOC125499483 n=1 Tax=Beta vulgaris subsp. vulgaris TaxID=3555 RepID=UPI0020370242|nr:uncharacterized protein LOC125499483 [Beta vulgaris subsp. vulgaris]